MRLKTKTLLLLPVFFCVVLFFLNPELYMTAFMKGLAVWSNSVLPSLFPFLFLANVIVNGGSLNFGAKNGFFGKLFKAPKGSAAVFVLSMLCGYPVGAKTIAELYENKSLTDSRQCYKLTTFCSAASPVYAIGTVGINFLKSFKAGIILYASILLGQILCGLIFRNKFVSENETVITAAKKGGIADAMYSAVISILTVGGYVALFYMICEMVSNVFSAALPAGAVPVVTLVSVGLLEMTNGCFAYAGCFPIQLATVLCALTMSFGGLCVFMQSFSFYKKCRMSGGKVLCIKLVQSILTGLVCLPLSLLFL